METAEIKAIPPSNALGVHADGALVRRVVGALVALASGSILVVAAWLTPAAEGHGTHTQLRMPQCGWVAGIDCPCPTCGMTTAFAHAADGHLVASFLAQPLGAMLAVATAMALLVSSFVAVTGSRVAHRLTRLWRPRLAWVIAALVLAAWGFKIITYKGWI